MKSYYSILLCLIPIFELKSQINDSIYKVALNEIKCENCFKIDTIRYTNNNIKKLVYHCDKSIYVIEDYYSKKRGYGKLLNDNVVLHGKFYCYSHPTGYEYGLYKNDLLEGKYFYFIENKLMLIDSYHKGYYNGAQINFRTNGSVWCQVNYKMGHLISEVYYDSAGYISKRGHYSSETYYDSTDYFRWLKHPYIDDTTSFTNILPVLKSYKKGKWKYYKDGRLEKMEVYKRKKLKKVIFY